jgi:hypothetical protein
MKKDLTIFAVFLIIPILSFCEIKKDDKTELDKKEKQIVLNHFIISESFTEADDSIYFRDFKDAVNFIESEITFASDHTQKILTQLKTNISYFINQNNVEENIIIYRGNTTLRKAESIITYFNSQNNIIHSNNLIIQLLDNGFETINNTSILFIKTKMIMPNLDIRYNFQYFFVVLVLLSTFSTL